MRASTRRALMIVAALPVAAFVAFIYLAETRVALARHPAAPWTIAGIIIVIVGVGYAIARDRRRADLDR